MEESKRHFDRNFTELNPKTQMVTLSNAHRDGELFAMSSDGMVHHLKTSDMAMNAMKSQDMYIIGVLRAAQDNVDGVEIDPMWATDENDQPVKVYKDATSFERATEDHEDTFCWGVYLHKSTEGGVQNIFDVPDKETAEAAEKILDKLYNL